MGQPAIRILRGRGRRRGRPRSEEADDDGWQEEGVESEVDSKGSDDQDEEAYLEEGEEEFAEDDEEAEPPEQHNTEPEEWNQPPEQQEPVNGNFLYLRPQDIRFSQANIRCTFQNGVTLDETLGQLATRCTKKRAVNMIRVVKHLGHFYTLHNRRLVVFRLLSILGEVRVIKMRLVRKTKEWHQKFDTKTDGTVVRVRGTQYLIGMDRSSTTFPLNQVRVPAWWKGAERAAQPGVCAPQKRARV